MRSRLRRLHHRRDEPSTSRPRLTREETYPDSAPHSTQEVARRAAKGFGSCRGRRPRRRNRDRCRAGHAAPPAIKADKPSHPAKEPRFKHPKLKHGELAIEGTEASDKIALRLQAGNAAILQVDVGDDGSADFSFDRADIAKIAVDAGHGDDLVRIDDSNGAFTDSIATTIDGGDGKDPWAEAPEPRAAGRRRQRLDRRQRGCRRGADGRRRRHLRLGSWRRQRRRRGPGRRRHDALQRRRRRRAGRPVGERQPAQVLPHPGRDHDGHRRRRAGRLHRPRRRRPRHRQRPDRHRRQRRERRPRRHARRRHRRRPARPRRRQRHQRQRRDRRQRRRRGREGERSCRVTQILHSEVANDRLEINTLAGTDTVDAEGLAAGAIQLLIDGIPVPES